MTNRLELNWKLDGFVDEQRYYCSDTPIDVNNLPAPKAIFAGGVRAYTDTDIVANQQYFIRVSAVKNGTEKVGEQIILDAKDYSKYTAYFRLIDFLDKKGGESLAAVGNAKIDNLAAYFDGAGDWLQRADASATTFATGDLTVECEFKCERIGTHTSDQVLVDNFINGSGGWQIALKSTGKVFLYLNTPNIEAIVSANSYSDGNWHKVKWTRSGSTNTLSVDGVSVGTYTDKRNFTQKTRIGVGAQIGSRNASYDFKGWIRRLGFAKQVL
jgi:hypothetical protein